MIHSEPSASRPRNPRISVLPFGEDEITLRELSTHVEPPSRNQWQLPRVRGDSIPDWNDLPTGVIARAALLDTIAPTRSAQVLQARSEAVVHARPAELALAVAAAVTLTLAVSFSVRGSSAESSSAQAVAARALETLVASLARALPAHEKARFTGSLSAAHAGIPVVSVQELPLEKHAPGELGGARRAAPLTGQVNSAGRAPASAAGNGGDRAALARALADAERAASHCGEGPVNAQVVLTFAPSGSVRGVHFAGGAPPVALRSCVLNTVARARIAPFAGEALTVSKTLRF